MSDYAGISWKVLELLNGGARITMPGTVEIGNEVNIDMIAASGVQLFPGTRIYGADTVIGRGARLGAEAPVTVQNCQIGEDVELKGGFFRESVFLKGASFGSGAQVREGCLIEEQAGGNHCVGLKQTILFPFVTLGSLVNLCDCLMAGGTSRKDHSEVGSSFIHFNYTPHQDKATASLIGDVPRGVMLDCAPIFLGGQGGIVGPARVEYGTVLAAGSIIREDLPPLPVGRGGRLTGGPVTPRESDFHCGLYRDIRRKTVNNIIYIANLIALRAWYRHIRSALGVYGEHGPALLKGADRVLTAAISERVKRFGEFAANMEKSLALSRECLPETTWDRLRVQKKELLENWDALEVCFFAEIEDGPGAGIRDRILEQLLTDKAGTYTESVRGLDDEARMAGTSWLQSIVDSMAAKALALLPSFR